MTGCEAHNPCGYESGTDDASSPFCWIVERSSDSEAKSFKSRLRNCESCAVLKSLDGQDVCAYRIDDQDQIQYVNNSWHSFAEQNNGIPSCSFDQLKGKSIWSQISDAESRMIYKKVFEKARSSKHTIQFRLHCDSIDTIRILKAYVHPMAHNWLEVRFVLLNESRRDPDALTDFSSGTNGLIYMCSYCGDLKDTNGKWNSIEDEITGRDIFKDQKLPMISHGVCPACRENFLNSLNEII